MAQNVYECMVILDPNKYAQDPGGLGATIPNLVAKCGGEVLVSRLWQEQKLAYPIGSHKKGAYWLTYFRLDSGKLVEFNRDLRINETVVRSLTLKVEPRLVEALVEHAKGGHKARPLGETAPAAAEVAGQPA
ncbi:MAG TPA: 30S ribosomal protein S6 [Pirellulaceae bacterium]|nr:30S ribosomal protein S6 [Pirellulaceae bacterium]